MLLRTFFILFISSTTFADQTVIPNYRTSRDNIFWQKLYPNGGSTLYCGQKFDGYVTLNIERVYPSFWMVKHLQCGTRIACRKDPIHKVRFNHMEADLHNLYPAMGGVNQARSNLEFAIIEGEARSLLNCDFEVDRLKDIAEPRPEVRGKITRSIFYMRREYGLSIAQGMLTALKQWHQDDPPSTEEIWRNDTIHRLQGTRNPFIDDPSLALGL